MAQQPEGWACDPFSSDSFDCWGGDPEGGLPLGAGLACLSGVCVDLATGQPLVESKAERKKRYQRLIDAAKAAGAALAANLRKAGKNRDYRYPAYLLVFSDCMSKSPGGLPQWNLWYQLFDNTGTPWSSSIPVTVHEVLTTSNGSVVGGGVWTLNSQGVFNTPDQINAAGIPGVSTPFVVTQGFYVTGGTFSNPIPGPVWVEIHWPPSRWDCRVASLL
jgi:hypothetical protein